MLMLIYKLQDLGVDDVTTPNTTTTTTTTATIKGDPVHDPKDEQPDAKPKEREIWTVDKEWPLPSPTDNNSVNFIWFPFKFSLRKFTHTDWGLECLKNRFYLVVKKKRTEKQETAMASIWEECVCVDAACERSECVCKCGVREEWVCVQMRCVSKKEVRTKNRLITLGACWKQEINMKKHQIVSKLKMPRKNESADQRKKKI